MIIGGSILVYLGVALGFFSHWHGYYKKKAKDKKREIESCEVFASLFVGLIWPVVLVAMPVMWLLCVLFKYDTSDKENDSDS